MDDIETWGFKTDNSLCLTVELWPPRKETHKELQKLLSEAQSLVVNFFSRSSKVEEATSPQGAGNHCSLSLRGQRRRTQVSWALGLWCCRHMLSGTTTAVTPGSVLLQNTLRFLSPRPQLFEHCKGTVGRGREKDHTFQKRKLRSQIEIMCKNMSTVCDQGL